MHIPYVQFVIYCLSKLVCLQVLKRQLDPLTEKQYLDVCNLQQSCQQAEDALFQGLEKLQHTLADSVAAGQLGTGSYIPQVATLEKLEALVSFANQVNIKCRRGFKWWLNELNM